MKMHSAVKKIFSKGKDIKVPVATKSKKVPNGQPRGKKK